MRLSAIEQGREQPAEVGVDLLVRVEQPHAAFAIEVADRAAEAVDRLRQFVGFLGAFGSRCVELGQFLLGDEIDRTDALALDGQSFKRRRF